MTGRLGVRKIENLHRRDKNLARRVEAMEPDLRRKGKKKLYYNCLTPLSLSFPFQLI
jgi:hypothetical protein